jgi:hypothetical protein
VKLCLSLEALLHCSTKGEWTDFSKAGESKEVEAVAEKVVVLVVVVVRHCWQDIQAKESTSAQLIQRLKGFHS